MALWNEFAEDVDPRPVFLRDGDDCYYARKYVSGGGYSASDANQLISNFKKSPDKRGTGQWYYKELAAKQFAVELSKLLPEDYCVVIIPTSKPDDHPEYDPRFDMMLDCLRVLRPKLAIEHPIIRTAACQALHTGGRRSITEALQTLEWQGFDGDTPDKVVLVDDVITCGTNFKACQRLLRLNCPGIEISGVFWARTVWLTGDEPEWDLTD